MRELVREVLGAAGVSALRMETITTLAHSVVSRVSAVDAGPGSVIVKYSDRASTLPLLRRELVFYSKIAPRLEAGVCPACYLCKDDGDECTLVLEDVPGKALVDGSPPDKEMVVGFVQALARLHRSARRIDRLADIWVRTFADNPYNDVAGRLAAYPTRLEAFLASESGTLDRKSISILESLEGLRKLFLSMEGDTIVHGDAHFGNAIFGNGPARLVDWGNVALGVGEIDVAHALAMNLPRSLGRVMEAETLDEYANCCGQALESTWWRYKAGVLYAITSSIAMWEFGLDATTWRYLLGNAIDAAVDLDAIEILE